MSLPYLSIPVLNPVVPVEVVVLILVEVVVVPVGVVIIIPVEIAGVSPVEDVVVFPGGNFGAAPTEGAGGVTIGSVGAV